MTTETTPATSGTGFEPDLAPLTQTAPAEAPEEPLRYRLLTGPDDRAFCERVSAALAQGYRLHGNPAVTFNGTRVIVAQAVVLDVPAAYAVPTWAAVTEADK